MRKLRSYEEKGLLMQYHSINIEKTAEANGALEMILK